MKRLLYLLLALALLTSPAVYRTADAEVTEADIARAAAAIQAAQQKADDAAVELEELREQERQVEADIAATNNEISALKSQLDELRAAARTRAVEAYKNAGTLSLTDLIDVENKSLDEYSRGQAYLDRVVENDGDTIGELKGVSTELEAKSDFLTELSAQKEQARVAQENLTEQLLAALAEAEVHKQSLEDQRAREEAARRAAEAARAARLAALNTSNEFQASNRVPVNGKVCPVNGNVSFINDWHFPRSGGRVHLGLDMFGPKGTPLVAVVDGVIRKVGNGGLGGTTLWIRGDDGIHYYYAHMDSRAVSVGQRVSVGQYVGTLGNTGNARTTPPQLHLQVHPGGGAAIPPYPIMVKLC